MIIGVPTEILNNEYRVGMTPAGVHVMVKAGHKVFIQRGAGLGSGLEKEVFAASGGLEGQGEGAGFEAEVEEAGTGDLGSGHEVRGEVQLLEHPFGGLAGVAPFLPGEDHREVGGEVAVAGVARALEHELDPVGAEPRGDPRQLGAECVAHSEAAFLFFELEEDSLEPALGAPSFAGLASGLSALAAASGFDALSLAGAVGSFRGPFPSFP